MADAGGSIERRRRGDLDVLTIVVSPRCSTDASEQRKPIVSSEQSPDMILHHVNETARRLDSLEQRTERLNLLVGMASRLEEWTSALQRRPEGGPARAEMDCIISDLSGCWALINDHRLLDEIGEIIQDY